MGKIKPAMYGEGSNKMPSKKVMNVSSGRGKIKPPPKGKKMK